MKQLLSLNRLSFELHIKREVLEHVANNKAKFYRPYIKPEKKRDGSTKERRIDNPSRAIRQIQKRINRIILRPECSNLPDCMTGSIPGRSIKDNAKPHVGSEAILSVDIANCFPSITSSMVYEIFRIRLGCSPAVAKILTKLTTYGDRIPQGAPTSPSLCNLVMEPLVIELQQLCLKNKVTFTQYVDDLTFSGKQETLLSLKPKVTKLVEKHGFKVNVRKLKLATQSERMEITGLVVNKFISVGRKYIRRVERDILDGNSNIKIKGKISHIHSISKSKARFLSRKLSRAKGKQSLEDNE